MTETTGTDVLRQIVKARNKSPHALSLIAGDIGVSPNRLEDFVNGKTDLDVAALKSISKLLCDADYDPEINRLRKPPSPPQRSLGVKPPPYAHAAYHPPQVGPETTGGIRLQRTPTSARLARRPGWA